MADSYTLEELKELLLEEQLKTLHIECEFNERYVRRAQRLKDDYKRAAIKRGIPELYESKPPPITLLNHKYSPEPKLFGEKYPIIPHESRLPILAYGLIPHFCFVLFMVIKALLDL